MEIAEPAVKAVVVNTIFTTLAFFFVCLRVFTRAFMIKNVGADDYLIIISMIASIFFFVTFMLQVKTGLGRLIPLPELSPFLLAIWATIPLYNLSLTLCKLSITVQCYRVLRTAPRLARFLRIYLFILAIYGLWAVFSSIFTCWPVDFYWNWMNPILEAMKHAAENPNPGAPHQEGEFESPQHTAKCMDRVALTFSNAAVNIATDFVLIFVPIPLLWRLQIPSLRQKVILVGVFGVTGGVAVVMSIVRLWSLYQMGLSPEGEESVHGVMIAIWSCIEINVAVVCASVPALRPLVGRLFPSLGLLGSGSRSRSRGYGDGYSQSRSQALSGVGRGGYSTRVRDERDDVGEGGGWGALDEDTMVMGTRSNVRGGSEPHLGRLGGVKGHIKVEQSFEMKSVLVGEEVVRDGRVLYVGDDDEKTSRDGSENNLVRG